jgi:hypothetical protein
VTPTDPQHSSGLRFGDDDKWEVDPAYAERDRYRRALERISAWRVNGAEAGLSMREVAREALAKTGEQRHG